MFRFGEKKRGFQQKTLRFKKKQQNDAGRTCRKTYVTRTAVSKWESGRGYPNIESLKDISELFSVSLNELLSGEELLSLAENKSKANADRLQALVFGLLDFLCALFIFIPLYGENDGEFSRAVNLIAYFGVSDSIKICYYVCLILLSVFGLAEIIFLSLKIKPEKLNLIIKVKNPNLIKPIKVKLFFSERRFY